MNRPGPAQIVEGKMRWLARLRADVTTYRAEITISVMSTALGILVSWLFGDWPPSPPIDKVQIGVSTATLACLIFLAFVLRRNLTSRVVRLEARVGRLLGQNHNIFDERRAHYAEEKSLLVDHLVRNTLAGVIDKVIVEHGDGVEVSIIVDSGTTLEGFFPLVKQVGFGRRENDRVLQRLKIFSNSLAGSNAFAEASGSALRDDQVHLFGGSQMAKYRAITGQVTLAAMEPFRRENRGRGRGVTIGIITANWLLVGPGYDQLRICSSEEDHLDYKRMLKEISDYLVVIAPLGKLLRLRTEDELNVLLRRKEQNLADYNGFSVTADDLHGGAPVVGSHEDSPRASHEHAPSGCPPA